MPERFEIYTVYKMALYKYSSFPFFFPLSLAVVADFLCTSLRYCQALQKYAYSTCISYA